jgi:hypothetical protein
MKLPFCERNDMTITTRVAALLEPAPGRPGLQPVSTVLSLAPSAGLGDRAMSRANHIVGLLTSLTDSQINALAPIDRRLLRDQLERVYRMVACATTMSDAQKSAAPEGGTPKRGKAAFLDELRDGRGRE